jgi:hypothetical protein
MPRTSRFRRWYSPAELARFLHHLALSGNMSAAAEAIGRQVRGLYNKRRSDRLFNDRCEAALAAFRSGPEAHRAAFAPAGASLRTHGGEWVLVRSGPQKGPQLRRAPQGQLTHAALRLFLRAVEATANLKLSAQSVGVSSQAIAARRRVDAAFDQAVVAALKEGCGRLETQLLESALRGLHGGRPADASDTGPQDGEEEREPPFPALPAMTVEQAYAFFVHQQEVLSRPKRWNPARDRQNLDLATARLEKALKRFAPRAKE